MMPKRPLRIDHRLGMDGSGGLSFADLYDRCLDAPIMVALDQARKAKPPRLALDPLTPKGSKIKAAMQREYGPERGERVFYASKNSGRIEGVDSPGTVPGVNEERYGLPTKSPTIDGRPYRDASGGVSLSDIYDHHQRDAEDRSLRRHRSGRWGRDVGASVQTTRRKSTYAGYR
jgi:hypothetical protein